MAHVRDIVCEPNCPRSIAGRAPIHWGDYLTDTRKRKEEAERRSRRRSREHQDIQLRKRLAGRNEKKMEGGRGWRCTE